MEEHKDDEHLDNTADPQSENLSDEIIPTENIDSINPNQETEIMEVHHHPDLRHKPKKRKEYFLEFLMIFLAVTLGFFAESIRENISNGEHAKILTRQLIRDLKADTANLKKSIRFEQSQLRTIDSLFFLLQEPVESADTKSIQQLISNMYNVSVFTQSTGAISAIERELNIKQFTNTELPELIAVYKIRININKQGSDLLFRLLEQNLEPFFYDHFTPANAYSLFAKNSLVVENEVRNLTKEDMTELSVKIEVINAILSSNIQSDEDLKVKAEEMIQYVIKQYHLKDE